MKFSESHRANLNIIFGATTMCGMHIFVFLKCKIECSNQSNFTFQEKLNHILTKNTTSEITMGMISQKGKTK